MMQQYAEAKKACGDALLLFRMGDFYELFYEDAKTAAKVLGLTLTSRDKGQNPIPMAGFPYHQLEGYLGKLIHLGFRAAVCEQVEDPKQAKGLVKREITRVVTPGTLTDDALLDPKQSNYLASLARDEKTDRVGLAWADLSTGRFLAATVPAAELVDQLARIAPSECLVSEQDPAVRGQPLLDGLMLTRRPTWAYSHDTARGTLCRQFDVRVLDGFGFDEGDTLAITAAGALLEYLQETQRGGLDHFDRLTPFRAGASLEIDAATRRSLELTRTMREGRREGSLLWVLDRSVSPMGSRLLADWLANPLTDVSQIEARLDAIEELQRQTSVRREARDTLRRVYDLERLLARVATGRASPRDLAFVGKTLSVLPELKQQLNQSNLAEIGKLGEEIDDCPDLQERLEEALADECPLASRDGGFIREGYSAELDDLRQLAAGGKQWIAQYQAEEAQRIGAPNLKVGFNKVFGYYLELSNAQRDKAPDTYIRKQTLKNAERYVTPELKEYEEKVLAADDRSKELEYDLFLELREQVQSHSKRLQATASMLGTLDALAALAELAAQRDYCRPVIDQRPDLEIHDGRHPVLDVTQPEGKFVPNDAFANDEDGRILLITGPNMAGKSTYIRQVALLTIMAQMGSFVPAKSARIGVADRVFARVGASDELSRGQSTFMVEMTETARILNTATPRSLVILDEIGRGTSTYDGVSLAWAIVEHLHDRVQCRTFFATHYHELTDLERSLQGVRNLNVAVKEWDETVVFLHKIAAGAADKSYGIHVARLAGVPSEVNERAKQVLAQLESEHLDDSGRPKIQPQTPRVKRGDIQLTLFGPAEHPLLDEIKALDTNQLTPLQCLQIIQQWQERLKA